MSEVAQEAALAAAFGTGILVGTWLAFRALKAAAQYLHDNKAKEEDSHE